MNRMSNLPRVIVRACLAATLLVLAACGTREQQHTLSEFACHAGAWRTPDGGLFVLTSTTTGAMRYRLPDGRSGLFVPTIAGEETTATEGWRSDGPVAAHATFGACGSDTLAFRMQDGPQGEARRVPMLVEDTHFDSGELSLRGRLLLPADATGPLPLAVLVHGSEDYSAVDTNAFQYLLPAQGVAVFVYDKRGTGGSDGRYTQDFHALAGDAVAALAAARRMHPDGFGQAGFVGASQGGWVAPLAASRSDADFAVALFGLAVSPLAEDRAQVEDDLRAKGHGEDAVEASREITDATGRLMASGFTEGFDALAAARKRHGDAPWFGDIRGEFSGEVAAIPGWAPEWIVRRIALRRDRGTSWDYEPVPVLRALDARQLWVVAGDDLEAPPAETLRRIRQLRAEGRPVDLALFPGTDHNMVEFETDGGTRTFIRHADGYFALVADWIAGRTGTAYGNARLEMGPSMPPPEAATE